MQTITVIGATGNQGSGVVSALLECPDFAVRAVSTNPSGPRAQALLARHLEHIDTGRLVLVKGNLDDPGSIEAALEDAHGCFAVGTYQIGEKGEESGEVRQGKTLVDALKSVGTKHFVYSSLPSVSKLSSGKLTHAVHYDSKAAVAEYALKQLPAVTLLIAGAFYSDLAWSVYARREEDGIVCFCMPLKPETKLQLVDERFDVGNFAAAVFTAGPSATAGKTYPIMAPGLTSAELAQEYHAATGEKVKVEPLTIEEAVKQGGIVGKVDFSKAFSDMFEYLDTVKPGTTAYGAMSTDDDESYVDLGIKASTLRDFLERTGFRVPFPREA
ncbi:hypothetical protein JCM10207_004261 [Rhodosporidiobolus poonsookiae]